MSDVLDFILNGNEVPNPNYNPRSKKNVQPKTIISNDPNAGVSELDIIKNIYKPTIENTNDYSRFNNKDEEYSDYGITVNLADSEEDINKARAKNQGAFEQFLRATGQAIASEVVIGSVKSLSDIVDAIINIGANINEEQTHDFTNPVSKYLEEKQDAIKESLAIYQENPGKAFDLTDTGWLFNNAVSIASTATMLIPTKLITGGVSLAYKGVKTAAKANKLGKTMNAMSSRGIAVAAKKKGLVGNAGKLRERMDMVREVGTSALLSRTMEGYMEARQVYREVYDDTLNRLNNMSDADKSELIKNNPDFEGLNNEQMAEIISGRSAEETFKNDYAMLAMDAIQFRALRGMFSKNITSKDISNNMRKQLDKTLNNYAGIAAAETEAVSKTFSSTVINTIKNNTPANFIKNTIKHPFKGLAAIEWSEGVEEAYQGIQTEKGKEVAERIFNPAFTARDLESYISDPHIWEQAVWGVLGAIGFAGIGKGLAYGRKKIEQAYDKKHLTDEAYTRKYMSEGMIVQEELDNWTARTNKLIDNIAIIETGRNPFNPVLDKNGKNVTDENGNTLYKDIAENEDEDLLKEQLISEYVTDVALQASKNGLYDLYKEFIKDSRFKQGVLKNAKDNSENIEEIKGKAFEDFLLEKMDEVNNEYENAIYNIYNSIYVDEPHIAQAMAHDIVRDTMKVNNIQERIDSINSQIATLAANYDQEAIDNYRQESNKKMVEESLKLLQEQKQKLISDLNDGKISKEAYEAYISDINDTIRTIDDYANSNILDFKEFSRQYKENNPNIDTLSLSEFMQEFEQFVAKISGKSHTSNSVPESIKKLIDNVSDRTLEANLIKSRIPTTQKQYEAIYERKGAAVDKLISARYDNAIDKIGKYLRNSEDVDKAFDDLVRGRVKGFEKELNLLKIGYSGTKQWTFALLGFKEAIKEERNKQQQANNQAVVNGQRLSPAEEQAAVNGIRQAEEEAAKAQNATQANNQNTQSPTSTGQGTQSNPTNPTNTAGIENNANSTQNNNTNQAPISPEEQAIIDYETSLEEDKIEISQEEEDVLSERDLDYYNDDETAATLKASAVITELIRNNPRLFDNINLDNNSSELEDIIKQIQDGISDMVHPDKTRNIAIYGLKIMLPLLKMKTKNTENINKLQEKVNELASGRKHALSKNGVLNIETYKALSKLVEPIIEDYIQATGSKRKSKGRSVVSLFDLIQWLRGTRENSGLIINDAQLQEIFINLYQYAKTLNNREKYKFVDINKFNNVYKTPNRLISFLNNEQYIEDKRNSYFHARISFVNNTHAMKLLKNIHNKEIKVQVMKNKNSDDIRFVLDGEEIAFIARVSPNSKNNGFTNTMGKNTNGFYITTTFENGEYSINKDLEDLFNLFNQSSNKTIEYRYFQILSKNATYRTQEDYDFIANNPIISKFIKDSSLFHFSENKNYTRNEKINIILNELNKLYDYEAKINRKLNLDDTIWINNFAKSHHQNYETTYTLQKAVANNSVKTITLLNTWDGEVAYGDTLYDVNTRNFDPSIHRFAIVEDDGIYEEGKQTVYSNSVGFPPGTAAIILRDAETGPAMALLSGHKSVSSNAKLANALKNELNGFLTKFLDPDNSYTFENLKDDLKLLLGGNNNEKRPTLFRDVVCIDNGDTISITQLKYNPQTKTNDFIHLAVINKFNKTTKNLNFGIIGYNKDGKILPFINKTKTAQLNELLDNIVSKTTFNLSFYPVRKAKNPNIKGTKYMTVNNDGSVDINLGGNKFHYNNYTEYIINENICTTNQEIVNGSYYFQNDTIDDVYFDITTLDDSSSPVGVSLPVADSVALDAIKSKKASEDLDTKEVLRLSAVPIEEISLLSGDNSLGIELIPKSIRYKDSIDGAAAYNETNDITYISSRFITAAKKNAINAKRLLIHERLHQLIKEKGVLTREGIFEDLKETYEAFKDFVENPSKYIDVNDKRNEAILKQVEEVKKALDPSWFNPTNYYDKTKLKNWAKKNPKEANEQFYEEWLVESLTNNGLINLLNNIQYGNTVIDNNAPKSLFQKIIDILLKIIGLKNNNINDNTIFAKQYSLLADNYVNTKTTVETNSKTNKVESKQEIDEIDTNAEPFIDNDAILDEDDDFNLDDFGIDDSIEILSITGETIQEVKINQYENNTQLNSNKISVINNMNDFVEHFPIEYRNSIQKMIDNNEISFICK